MEVLCSSKTSIIFYQPIRRKITEDLSLFRHLYDKHKFRTIYRYNGRSHSIVSKDSGREDLLFPEDGDTTFLFNVRNRSPIDTASYCRRPESSELQV